MDNKMYLKYILLSVARKHLHQASLTEKIRGATLDVREMYFISGGMSRGEKIPDKGGIGSGTDHPYRPYGSGFQNTGIDFRAILPGIRKRSLDQENNLGHTDALGKSCQRVVVHVHLHVASHAPARHRTHLHA